MFELLEKKYIAVLLILGISLAAFYPTLNSNVIDLDDTNMVLNLNNPDGHFSGKDLFWPRGIGRYYRPLLMLSFIIDSQIWAFEYSGYHLTNMVFHLLNAIIFYFIALYFFNGKSRFKIVSFFLAIGFGLHPLSIESVAWISGRTDILSGFLSLSAFLFYLSKIRFKAVFVSIFFLSGLFAKENAFCLFIFIPVCELALYSSSRGFKKSMGSALSWVGLLCIPLLAYLYLRFAGFNLFHLQKNIQPVIVQGLHIQKGISMTSQMISNLFMVPAVIAFYLKKLFCPFPLNFAIFQINVVAYSILFAVLGVTCSILVLKKKYYFPLWIILLTVSFLPSVPVALADIAWTRFAERYLYLSIPVACLFAGDLYIRIKPNFPKQIKIINTIAFLIWIVFCCGSIQRIHVWKDKQSLWEDTYKKNPANGKVLYKYGSVLGAKKGLPYFKKAVEVAGDNDWKDLSLLALASDSCMKKDYTLAVAYVRQAIQINPNKMNLDHAAGMMKKIINGDEKNYEVNRQVLIQIYQKAYNKYHRPVDLYNLVNIYKRMGDTPNEEKYYQMLLNRFPDSRAARHLFRKYNN